MNTIELKHFERLRFCQYLSTKLDGASDLRRFFIDAGNSEGEYTLTPAHGEFRWTHEGETFLITYSEEGEPHENGYFQRFCVQHPNLATLKAFVVHAITVTAPKPDRKIQVFHNKSCGYWDSFSEIYVQQLDGIYLDPSIKSSLDAHIDTFVQNKGRYLRFGRPYKLNFLLTGVPGSGKSSLVKAIASKYGRSLYVLNFSKSITDESLLDVMTKIKEDAVLLIEDIDAFFVDRKATDVNVSFSCLINILDGALGRNNGLLTFLTANNPERLDQALIRPGRVDRVIRFDYPRKQEIHTAFKDLTGDTSESGFNKFYQKIKGVRIPMSGIVDLLFRYPDNYIEHIDELLEQTQIIQELVNDKSEKMYT